jgi:hypothetical protein
MSDAWNMYIERCKQPKSIAKVEKIVEKILKGFRLGLSSSEIAEKMNGIAVYTLMNKRWTANSLQMQALKMARFDADSSLAWGFAKALANGLATQADVDLLNERTNKSGPRKGQLGSSTQERSNKTPSFVSKPHEIPLQWKSNRAYSN